MQCGESDSTSTSINTRENRGQGIRILSLGEHILELIGRIYALGGVCTHILASDNGGPGAYSQLLIIKEYVTRLAKGFGVDSIWRTTLN
jgi:hypothetical protein